MIFTSFSSLLGINIQETSVFRRQIQKLEDKRRLFIFYFDVQLTGRYFRGGNQKSEVYPGSDGNEEKRIRSHVIKGIQGHEINIKTELFGSLCAKSYRWFELFSWISTPVLPPKIPQKAELAKPPYALTQRPKVKSSYSWYQAPW